MQSSCNDIRHVCLVDMRVVVPYPPLSAGKAGCMDDPTMAPQQVEACGSRSSSTGVGLFHTTAILFK